MGKGRWMISGGKGPPARAERMGTGPLFRLWGGARVAGMTHASCPGFPAPPYRPDGGEGRPAGPFGGGCRGGRRGLMFPK